MSAGIFVQHIWYLPDYELREIIYKTFPSAYHIEYVKRQEFCKGKLMSGSDESGLFDDVSWFLLIFGSCKVESIPTIR